MTVHKRINLLPADLKPKLEFQPEMLSLGIGVFFFASVIVTSTNNYFAISHRQRQLASIQAEKQDLSTKVAALKAKDELLTQRQARLVSFQEIVNRKTYWVEMFKELTTLMPKEVWLTNLNSTFSEHDKNLTLKGEAASQGKVAEFLSALEKSTYFNTIVMKTSEKQDEIRPDLYKFEFSVPITPTAAAPAVEKGGKS
jgi:Tfp pilus assembly protein PilN